MKSIVVELHLLSEAGTDVAAAGKQVRAADAQLNREGPAVRWVRSVYAPEHETCVVVFELIVEGGQ